MNRRSFLRGALALLPLPAFIPAASLWLPKERPFVAAIDPFGPEFVAAVQKAIRHMHCHWGGLVLSEEEWDTWFEPCGGLA